MLKGEKGIPEATRAPAGLEQASGLHHRVWVLCQTGLGYKVSSGGGSSLVGAPGHQSRLAHCSKGTVQRPDVQRGRILASGSRTCTLAPQIQTHYLGRMLAESFPTLSFWSKETLLRRAQHALAAVPRKGHSRNKYTVVCSRHQPHARNPHANPALETTAETRTCSKGTHTSGGPHCHQPYQSSSPGPTVSPRWREHVRAMLPLPQCLDTEPSTGQLCSREGQPCS